VFHCRCVSCANSGGYTYIANTCLWPTWNTILWVRVSDLWMCGDSVYFTYEHATGLYTFVLLRMCKSTLGLHNTVYTNVNSFVATDMVTKLKNA